MKFKLTLKVEDRRVIELFIIALDDSVTLLAYDSRFRMITQNRTSKH